MLGALNSACVLSGGSCKSKELRHEDPQSRAQAGARARRSSPAAWSCWSRTYRMWTVGMHELGASPAIRASSSRPSARRLATWPGSSSPSSTASPRRACSPTRSKAGCKTAGAPPCGSMTRSTELCPQLGRHRYLRQEGDEMVRFRAQHHRQRTAHVQGALGRHSHHLCWQYWTPGGEEPEFARPQDPKYRRKIEMWKKMPLWASRMIGPVISPALP